MVTRTYWVRCCVDLDSAGNTIGCSYEAHDRDGYLVGLYTEQPGPFETPHEAFQRIVEAVVEKFGLQPTLF